MTKVRDTSLAWQRLHMVLVLISRQKEVSVGSDEVLLWAKRLSDGSDEVLSSLSSLSLYCKLNGKRVSDQRSKCWRNAHERFQWSFCGCIDYSCNISKTSASVSSGVPNTEKVMKARGRRPSASIVSRCLEPLMKHEARVFDMASQMKQ